MGECVTMIFTKIFGSHVLLTLALFLGHSTICVGNNLTQAEADELNIVFKRDLTVLQWESMKHLHIPDGLPDEQFPIGFEKLAFGKSASLKIVDLFKDRPEVWCEETDLSGYPFTRGFETRKTANQNLDKRAGDTPLCLSGRKYKIIGSLGKGDTASVYKIAELFDDGMQEDFSKVYAFTRYDNPGKRYHEGALLALALARLSKDLLNMPLVININKSYIISPMALKGATLGSSDSVTEFIRKHNLAILMAADNLFGLWDAHKNNFMRFFISGKIVTKMIDLRTFKKLDSPGPQKLLKRVHEKMKTEEGRWTSDYGELRHLTRDDRKTFIDSYIIEPK